MILPKLQCNPQKCSSWKNNDAASTESHPRFYRLSFKKRCTVNVIQNWITWSKCAYDATYFWTGFACDHWLIVLDKQCKNEPTLQLSSSLWCKLTTVRDMLLEDTISADSTVKQMPLRFSSLINISCLFRLCNNIWNSIQYLILFCISNLGDPERLNLCNKPAYREWTLKLFVW